MRASFLKPVIERIGHRLALLLVALALAGVSAGARLIWTGVTGSKARPAATTAIAGMPARPAAAMKPGYAPEEPAAPVMGPPAPASVVVARPAPSKPGVATAKPAVAATPSRPSGLQARSASASAPAVSVGAAAPARPAGTRPAATPLAVTPAPSHLDEQLTYQYEALGRRDPFQALVGGGFVGMDVGGDAPVDVGGIKVVGIVWGSEDKFAMVEDARGQSNVLRVGDKVQNGVITGLKRDALVVTLTVDGQSQTVAIPLIKKGDQSNANR